MPCNWCWERTAHFRQKRDERRGDSPSKIATKSVFTILLQRPDIMEAEYQLKAADAILAQRERPFSPQLP